MRIAIVCLFLGLGVVRLAPPAPAAPLPLTDIMLVAEDRAPLDVASATRNGFGNYRGRQGRNNSGALAGIWWTSQPAPDVRRDLLTVALH